jgi:Fuc2NAc and GlcNAc transferase
MSPLVWSLLVLGLSATGTFLVREYSARRGLLDRPNQRSSHTVPTPRLGGVAIAAATLAGWVSLPVPAGALDALVLRAAIGGGIAALVGLVDDLMTLSPPVKFGGEVVAVVVPLSLGFPAHPTWMHVVLFAVAMVLLLAYVNFFNFMDGSDGLAGGVAVCAALGLAALLADTGAGAEMWMAMAVAAGAAGFLLYNRPPASIFMGDAGSLFLGYALGLIAVALAVSGTSTVPPALVLTPFVFDPIFTLARRAKNREVLWRAHRSHLYQRLLKTGATHGQVALLYCAWTVVSCGAAWLWTHVPATWQPWSVVVALLPGFVLVMYVQRRERRTNRPAAV